eukprot:TRINITY_DN2873_c0_g1_i4.p1 TRINITY_DN2873_c0_g1~~TRINITY_DN2873_c0_g1_i4.p1  ORF type:complete len:327 (+),score=77.81 TRINITY_DN2873_c0_g1_i4:467-1447(+)
MFGQDFAFALGFQEAAALVGSLLGPAFSGWLYEVDHTVLVPCIAFAAICGVVAVFQLFLPPPQLPNEEAGPLFKPAPVAHLQTDDLKKTLKETVKPAVASTLIQLLRDPRVWFAYLTNVCLMIQMGFSYSVIPIYMDDTLHASAGVIGTLFALSVVGDMASSLGLGYLFDRRRDATLPCLALGGWLSASLPALLVVLTNVWAFGAVFLCMALFVQGTALVPSLTFFDALNEVTSGSETQEAGNVCEIKQQGKAFGLYMSSFYLGFGFSTFATPFWELVGAFYTFVGTGSLLAVVVSITIVLELLHQRRQRHCRAAATGTEGLSQHV